MPQGVNGDNISRHILSTSSNLLGFCFILINFLKLWRIGRTLSTLIDKSVALAIVLFLSSSILSYSSMRAAGKKSELYERIADIVFIVGLVFISMISIMISFEVL